MAENIGGLVHWPGICPMLNRICARDKCAWWVKVDEICSVKMLALQANHIECCHPIISEPMVGEPVVTPIDLNATGVTLTNTDPNVDTNKTFPFEPVVNETAPKNKKSRKVR